MNIGIQGTKINLAKKIAMFKIHCYFCLSMKNIIEFVNKNTDIITLNKSIQFIECFYIKKYGSHEKAVSFFKEFQDSCQNEEEFQDKFWVKFNEDFRINDFMKIFKPYFEAEDISSFVKSVSKFKTENKDNFTFDQLTELDVIYTTLIKPAFEEVYNLSDKTSKNNFVNNIIANIKFSLAKTRKELGYPDQRTFNKWLNGFFGDKYINRGNTNGYISLEEYIEIVCAFILSYNEDKKDLLYKAEELSNRFDNEKNISKKVLKKLTKNNYQLLNERLEDMAKINKLNIPVDVRNFPYSIVSILKNELNNYNV